MWFSNNHLILNPDKCKAMVISNNTQTDDLIFTIDGKPIPKVDSLELLGTIVDKSLYFSNLISKISKKVGRQLDVLSRFKKILSCSTKMCLYKSFIIPHFSYCSSVWQNCLKADSKKLEKLNERALRYVTTLTQNTKNWLVVMGVCWIADVKMNFYILYLRL